MIKKSICILIIFLLSSFSLALADEIARGKALYNDPKLGGGTRGKSCASCHPESSAARWLNKKEYSIMGNKAKSIEEAVNICIKNAMGGKGLDAKSADMKALVAYIKSLSKK